MMDENLDKYLTPDQIIKAIAVLDKTLRIRCNRVGNLTIESMQGDVLGYVNCSKAVHKNYH